jgi:hypothetical protein
MAPEQWWRYGANSNGQTRAYRSNRMILRRLNNEIATTYGGIPSDVRKQIDRLMAAGPVADTKGAVKNYHELDSL